MSDYDALIGRNLRWNFSVHAFDAGAYGVALGFASFVTILPLFVASLTGSALLVGLIAVVHPLGWNLPQLLTAGHVGRLRRYMPTVLKMTVIERVPFFGLALLAWLSPRLAPNVTLTCTYLLVMWIGLGGGLTATAFQSLVAKIVPRDLRGTFYGIKSASATLCVALGGLGAGVLLTNIASPYGFTTCFLLASGAVTVSYVFLALTREPDAEPVSPVHDRHLFRANLRAILRRDASLRAFVAVRMLSQVAVMATAFFTVYALRVFGMSAATAGVMTAVLAGSQTIANPAMGWLGDRLGYRPVMAAGMLAASAAALVAWRAPDLSWFYLVFALAGVAAVATWTIPLAMVLEFGAPADRPSYIGLANTLFAPSIVLAPLVGGWLADEFGYGATFCAAAAGGVAAAILLAAQSRAAPGERAAGPGPATPHEV